MCDRSRLKFEEHSADAGISLAGLAGTKGGRKEPVTRIERVIVSAPKTETTNQLPTSGSHRNPMLKELPLTNIQLDPAGDVVRLRSWSAEDLTTYEIPVSVGALQKLLDAAAPRVTRVELVAADAPEAA